MHVCKCFSEVWSEFHRCISAWFVQWDTPVFLISLELLRGWAIGVVRSRWPRNLWKRNFWPKSQTPLLGGLAQGMCWSASWSERLFLMKGTRKKMWVSKMWNAHVQVQTWYGDGRPHVNCACTETTACRGVNSSVNNWTETQETQKRQTCPSQVEGQTWNRTRELETAFRHYILAHAGNLKFRFQHGPFTERFRPVVTSVSAVVLSKFWFSRLAVTRAWLFALNELTSEGTGTYSHFGPRPLRMSWLTCCCCGHCLWNWTFPHGLHKQQTNVCTD